MDITGCKGFGGHEIKFIAQLVEAELSLPSTFEFVFLIRVLFGLFVFYICLVIVTANDNE